MALVDYASNFWGDKHIGYSVLYENMKKGEESVHELLIFLKERINMEDDLFKSLGKGLNRVNGYISNNSEFVDAWKLAKETLEFWTDSEIQSSMLRNLNELLREVTRYQEELTRMRKRAKDAETLEIINLMQTTTTCLQKARDTYNQRRTEVATLKQNNKEWTAASTREFIRARNKLIKAHEEYKQYVDKYNQTRDIFEHRVSRAAHSFQEHDRLHLLQMKRFFAQMAKCMENGHGAHAQVSAALCQNVEQNVNVEDIMLRFTEEKCTGAEPPQKIQWTDADELPAELDVVSCVQSQSSSSNSSAIVPNFVGNQLQPNVNQMLGLNDSWLTGGGDNVAAGVCAETSANDGGSIDGMFGESVGSLGVNRGSINGYSEQNKSSAESDSERHLEVPFPSAPSSNVPAAAPTTTSSFSTTSYMPQQISSWLGRQKLSGRLKKHFSSSQSNLAGPMANEVPSAAAGGTDQTKNGAIGPTSNFSMSYNDPLVKTNPSVLLKRYQKGKAMKRSMGDLTLIGKSQPERATNISLDASEQEIVRDPLEVFGPPPPLPTTEPPQLDDELVNAFGCHSAVLSRNQHDASSLTATKSQTHDQLRHHSVSFVSTPSESTADDEQLQQQRCASSSSTSSGDEEEECLAAQRSKIRQLQIRPLNDTSQQSSKLNASVDELRTAIGQITLSKCKDSENDPWGDDPVSMAATKPSDFFSNSRQYGPIRAALTGDEHLRRKYNKFPLSDFSQSVAVLSGGSTIARARPRSHIPLLTKHFGMPASSTSFIGIESKEYHDTSTPTRPIPTSQATTSNPMGPSSVNFELVTTSSVVPLSFDSSPLFIGGGPFAQNFSSSSSSPMALNLCSTSNCKVPETIPIAMAINEYLHVWFKAGCPLRPEVRLFGTLMFSLRADSLDQLQTSADPSPSPLRFTLIGAEKLKMIVPNKIFFNESEALLQSRDSHQFAVERQKLSDFLRERVQNNAQSSFFNADLLRYELPVEFAPRPLPLHFSTRWIRFDKSSVDFNGIIEFQIDYQWSKIGEKAPQNVVFSTKVLTQSGNGVGISLLSSEPPAQWLGDHSVLNWEFPPSAGGTLRAFFKCSSGLVPSNTHAQFQFSDASLSGAQVHLDEHAGFVLSIFRKKLLAGKYFCEPFV